MTERLKQSTAVVIQFGPFVDKTDGVTLETGLVSALDHATTGILLSKNGGTLAVRHATVTATTYDAHGNYKVTLDTTDTGTLGKLRVIYTDAATCLPVWRDFEVVPAMIYDSMVLGSDDLDTNTTKWLGTACATPTVAGVPEVDVTHWIGTACATPTVAGVPEVDVTHIGGGAQSATDLKDFADTGYNPVTHYIAGIEGTLNQFDDLNNAVTAPTAAQNRAEMDSNSTQLAAIVDDTGTSGVVLANDAITAAKIAANAIGASELAADAAQEIADALLDRATAIEGYTPRQAMRLILAALAAKLSGAATTTVAIRDIADSKDRITATVDADGNRTAVTLDAT